MCIDESYEDKELVGVVRCAARVIRHGRVDMLFSDRHGAPSVSWLLLWTVAEGTLMRRRVSPPSCTTTAFDQSSSCYLENLHLVNTCKSFKTDIEVAPAED